MNKEYAEILRNNTEFRSNYISDHTNFVLSSASKAVGRFVSKEDDVFSVALIAFDEAIMKFDESKGEFFAFAELIIKRRIIDEYRKSDKKVVPFSSIQTADKDGDEQEIDIVGKTDIASDVAFELGTFKNEILKYGFTLFDIPKDSPKSRKTKNLAREVLEFISTGEQTKNSILNKGEIPVKTICENLKINKKFMERHRKYIIAATIILSGDYPIISQYIKGQKEVEK